MFLSLSSIVILYLDSNQLTGTIHWEIKHLAQIVDLRLRKNFVRINLCRSDLNCIRRPPVPD
jgi:hypothetical protein